MTDTARHPPAFPDGAPSWPPVDEEVRLALQQAYADGDWGRYHGENCRALESDLRQFHELEFVTLCCSGTVAVELALRGLQVGAGDEVVLAAYDFPGNFRAVEAVGARVVLVDIDPCSASLDPEHIRAACGPATKALLVSHLHGGVAPMRKMMELARELGLKVVEDACQAPGALVEGRVAGTWGDAGVLSFGGSKLLTAGRGGAVLCGDAGLHQRIKIFCDRGNQAFPLSELQACVLRPQLAKLPQRNAVRLAAAQRLQDHLSSSEQLRAVKSELADTAPAYYKFGMWHHAPRGGADRQRFIAAAQAEGLALDAGFRGFAGRGEKRCRKVGELPSARRAARAMLLLHHPVLLEPPPVIDRLIEALARLKDI